MRSGTDGFVTPYYTVARIMRQPEMRRLYYQTPKGDKLIDNT